MELKFLTNMLAGVALSALLMGCDSEFSTKLPFAPTEKPIPASTSRITVGAEINLAALRQKADAAIPNPIVTINESRGGCYKKRIAGIKVSVGCDIWGNITKRGGLSLTGDGGTISMSLPIHATVSGRTHKIHIQETANADATIFADAVPTLDKDWHLALNLRPDFRWDQRPTICVILNAICFTVGSLVEPKVRDQLAGAVAQADAEVAKLDIRSKVEEAWKGLAKPIKLSSNPDVWLSVSPKKIGFGGITVNNDILSTNAEVVANLQSSIGAEPALIDPGPLPPLTEPDGEVSTFEISLPFEIGYEQLNAQLASALKKGTAWNPDPGQPDLKLTVSDVEVYPSNGRVVIGVTGSLDTPENLFDISGTVYFAATQEVDNANSIVRLRNLALTSETDSAAANALLKLIASEPIMNLLETQAAIPFGAKYDDLLQKASAEMTKDLGNGLRSEGRLEKVELADVVLGESAMRLDLKAAGSLKILFGM